VVLLGRLGLEIGLSVRARVSIIVHITIHTFRTFLFGTGIGR